MWTIEHLDIKGHNLTGTRAGAKGVFENFLNLADLFVLRLIGVFPRKLN